MKKALKIILIIVAILAVLTGIFAILWFFTPVFNFLKPASDNFSIQAKKLFGGKEMSYSEYLESIEPLKVQNESYTSTTEVSANVSVPSSIVDYSTQRMINNSKLKYEASYDADTKATQANVKLTSSSDDVLNFNAVINGKKIVVESKDMHDKAIVFDMDKAKEFCKANNIEMSDAEIDEITKSLESANNQESANLLYELMYLTQDEYNTLHKDYGDIFKIIFDNDCYSTKKNQKVSVGDDEVKTTGYVLTIKGKDLNKYAKKLAEDAKGNDNLKSILVKKMNLIKKYAGNAAGNVLEDKNAGASRSSSSLIAPSTSSANLLAGDSDITAGDIEKMFDELIDSIDNSKDDSEVSKGAIKLTIYADKKGNPVKFEAAVCKDEDDDGKAIFTEDVEDGKKTYTIDFKAIREFSGSATEDVLDYSASSTMSSSSAMNRSNMSSSIDKLVIVDRYSEGKDSRNGTMTISVKADDEKQEVAKIDYEYVNSKSEKKINIKLSSSSSSAMELTLNAEATGLDSDNQNMNILIDGSIPFGYSSAKVKLNMNTTRKLGSSNVKKYDDTNSIDLFSKSSEEAKTIVNELVNNLGNNLPGKLSKLGIHVTKEQLFGGMSTSTPAVVEPAPVAPAI